MYIYIWVIYIYICVSYIYMLYTYYLSYIYMCYIHILFELYIYVIFIYYLSYIYIYVLYIIYMNYTYIITYIYYISYILYVYNIYTAISPSFGWFSTPPLPIFSHLQTIAPPPWSRAIPVVHLMPGAQVGISWLLQWVEFKGNTWKTWWNNVK